ncbi:MAG TPA: YggS family pyridoxal phosphate enzyme [Acidimicrobiales bacterium]|nr:YggS family pyridoxal phosphate enzyme [Acidimicrobiales bacterium]
MSPAPAAEGPASAGALLPPAKAAGSPPGSFAASPEPASDVAAEVVAANLAAVRRRIEAAGGDPGRITVVAVTKGFGPGMVAAAAAAGLAELGENYAQELVAKAASAPDGVRWHFLGPVQRNKVAMLAPHVHLWQALDRLVAGEAIAARQPGAAVLVQVDVNQGIGKPGCHPNDTAPLVGRLREAGLDVRGLMAVGPAGDPELARPGFRLLAALAGELGLAELSMGMSEDLEVAVQEGATMVRVGRALFGPRPGTLGLRR